MHGLSSFLVCRLAAALTPAVAADIRKSVAACRAEMAKEGFTKSVVARLCVAPGSVVQGPVSVLDRTGAYLAECAAMSEFPELRRVFSDPVAALRQFADAMQGTPAARLRADIERLFGPAVDAATRKKHLKSLYKEAYGKLGNASTADKKMPAALVADLKPVAELARRRNALCMLWHAKVFCRQENIVCLGIATDALFVRGATDLTLARMGKAPRQSEWQEEARGDLLLFGSSVNTYVLASSDGNVVARPRHMFTTELSLAKTPSELAALRQQVVAAGRLPTAPERRAAFEACLAQVPQECATVTREGKRGVGKPSLRFLLEHLCGHKTAETSSKVFRKLNDAVRAQQSRAGVSFVVARACVNQQGHEFRTFRVVPPHRLREVCFGRKDHVVFVGDPTRVGYRAMLDWDAPVPLAAQRVDAAASRLRTFWSEQAGLEVVVRALRTRTRRTGAKQHAEHVVFLATDAASGKECVLLNVTEIPAALGVMAKEEHPFDTEICKWRKSLRLPSAPTARDEGTTSAHVPKDCTLPWNPDPDEFLRWCPVVALDPDRTIGYCNTPPPNMVSAVAQGADDTTILLPSAQTTVRALWAYLRRACEAYKFSRESVRFFTLNNEFNQFLVNVDIERNGKYLDFKSFMRRVMLPDLSGGAAGTAERCNHRSSNRSFFLLDVDLTSGCVWRVKAKTHAEKTAAGGAPNKRRRTHVATDGTVGTNGTVTNRGEVLMLCNPSTPVPSQSLCALLKCGGFWEQYERQIAAERLPLVTLLRTKNTPGAPDFPRCRGSPKMVWSALHRRHRVLCRRARQLPDAARAQDEQRPLNLRSTCHAVSFLALHADRALAMRAVCAEKQFYATHHKDAATTGPLLALLDHHLQAVKDRGESGAPLPGDGNPDVKAAWEKVLGFAARFTYAHEVF